MSGQAARLGFTLAEVLITLGIIGVVAAITMPTLVSNHKKKVYVNQLKKTYSVLNQGFKKYMVNNSCIDSIFDCNFKWNGNDENFVKPLKESFEILDYESKSGYGKFSKDFANYKISESLNPVNYDTYYGDTSDYVFLLKDGTTILTTDNYIANQITVDINGKNRPNIVGRDIFEFNLMDNGSVVPYMSLQHLKLLDKLSGVPADQPNFTSLYEQVKEEGCGKYGVNKLPDNASGISGFGSTCADRIIYEGWQMNY